MEHLSCISASTATLQLSAQFLLRKPSVEYILYQTTGVCIRTNPFIYNCVRGYLVQSNIHARLYIELPETNSTCAYTPPGTRVYPFIFIYIPRAEQHAVMGYSILTLVSVLIGIDRGYWWLLGFAIDYP